MVEASPSTSLPHMARKMACAEVVYMLHQVCLAQSTLLEACKATLQKSLPRVPWLLFGLAAKEALEKRVQPLGIAQNRLRQV